MARIDQMRLTDEPNKGILLDSKKAFGTADYALYHDQGLFAWQIER